RDSPGRKRSISTGPQQTSINNVEYDLYSMIYHSLKSSQAYVAFVRDAQAAGNQGLLNFFQQMLQQNDRCAHLARQLLVKPTQAGAVSQRKKLMRLQIHQQN